MIKINLLPVKAAKKKEKVIYQLLVGGLVILLTFAGVGYRYYSQQGLKESIQAEIKSTDAKIAKLREAKKKFEELTKRMEILKKQVEAIKSLDTGRDWFIRIIDKITESVPHGQVWIESIKFGGGRGKNVTADTIVIKGKTYDRDSVAIFMGNLSQIPCDDLLPDEEKAQVCRDRNEACRRFNQITGNFEMDFEGCRNFYKKAKQTAESCDEDLKICKQNQQDACRGNQNAAACENAKKKCEEIEKNCSQQKENNKKLHQEEYVLYDSINLMYLTTKKAGSNQAYDFEIRVRGAAAPTE